MASWLKTSRLLKEDKLCRENIQFMKDVLDGCVRKCHHYRATGFVPSRFLDLGSQMSLDSIRLIDSSQIVPNNASQTPRYAALSYCWGSPVATDNKPHLCTTVQSLESMKLHVHEQVIPPVILDACKVCKALSIRYLWVDSLCIIQDEKSDWERESPSMTLIYKNAFVTICTPSSNSSNEGFLVRRRKHVAVPFRSRVVPSIHGHYNLVASGRTRQFEVPSWPELDVDGTSWSTRGWTLQEFEMSNRVLIFGESMIHFLCRHNVQSENGYRRNSAPSRVIQTLDPLFWDNYPEKYYRTWESMLHGYGRRLFTIIEDRLPAISGMAKYIADETGDEYLAGLWKSELPSSLLWSAECHENVKYHIELPDLLRTLHSPKPYIAPSWSPIRMDVDFGQGFMGYYISHYWATSESTIINASVQSVGENPFGRVKGGCIRIRGRFSTVSSDLTRLPCYRYSDADLWHTLDKGIVTYYMLDCCPKGNSCGQGGLSRLLIKSTARGWSSMHERNHYGSYEAAHRCLTKHLPVHAASHRSTPDLKPAGLKVKLNSRATKLRASVGQWLKAPSKLRRKSTRSPNPTINGSPDKNDPGNTRSFTEFEDPRYKIGNRDALGLLIHPLPGTNEYVRVGLWASLAADGGGTALFDDVDEREIDLV